MKKRLLAMLLCVAMVASLLTVGAVADNAPITAIDGAVMEHTVDIGELSDDEATYTASSSSGEDGLVSLTVTDINGDEISLLDGGVAIRLGSEYTFKAGFSDPDSIKSVYITSTIGSDVKMLEAVRNGDVFVTSGYFDGDSNYIPGSIGVKYTVIPKTIDINAPVDWQPMIDAFEDTAEVTAMETAGENVSAQFDLSGLLKSEAGVLLNVAVEMYDESYGTSFDDFIGAYNNYKELLSYELNDRTTVYVDKTGVQTYFMLVEEKVDNGEKFVKMLMELDDDRSLKDVAEALGKVGTIVDFTNSYLDINAEANELREEISERRDLNAEEAEALNDKVDEYESDKQLFNLSMTVLPLIAASAAPTAGASIIFGGIVGMISTAANYFWDYRVGMITGSEPANTSFINGDHGTALTDIYMWEHNNTLSSGTYYMAERFTDDIIVPEGTTVSICLHNFDSEYYGYTIKNYGALSVYNCGNDVDGVDVSARIQNYGGNVTVNGADGWIDNFGGGRISVFGGSIDSIKAYGEENEPGELEIQIYNGDIGIISIENSATGNIYVHDGIIDRIISRDGYICIYGGSIGDSSRSNNTTIEGDCHVDINGGTIWGFYYPEEERYRAAISCVTLTINSPNAIIYGDVSADEMTIFEGVVYGNVRGSDVVIHDGVFNGCVSAGGTIYEPSSLIINGGEFYAEDDDYANIMCGRGDLEINGGYFYASKSDEYEYACRNVSVSSAYNSAIINGGTFINEDSYCVENHDTAYDDSISKLIINGGSFKGKEHCVVNYELLIINDGNFEQFGQGDSHYCCIKNTFTRPELTINGGSFHGVSRCIESDGTLDINGGIFSQTDEDTFYSILIENTGNLTIDGGVFTSNGETIRNAQSSDEIGTLTINAGVFNKNGQIDDYHDCIRNQSILTVNGGTFNMQGGGYCIESSDTATINGGTFNNNTGKLSCINSYGTGNLTVNYGVFNMSDGYSGIETFDENTVISGLRFNGPKVPYGVNGQKVTLLVDTDFFLEIDSDIDAFGGGGGSTVPDIIVNIELTNGYTGGLRYYDSKDSEGVTLSADEFDQIDFSSDYLRLEADGVPPGGPDDEPDTDCEHSYVTTIVEPTCENRGYTVYTCIKCGHTYMSNYVDANGHSYGEWIVTREPTDSTAGQRERICSVCNEKEVETIPATGTDTPVIVGPGWTPSFSVNTPIKTENGNVSISDTMAEENEMVVITVSPDDGYELDKLVVTDANGNEINVVALGNGQFEFTMPATAVSIEATFAKAMVNTFVDVSVADWFVDAVKYVVRHSIMEGISDNEFAPLSTMSRAMVWTILARIDGETVTGAGWIDEALSWAMADGISDGTDPNGLVTREQFATMLYRYAGEPEVSGNLSAYTDASSISDWAQDAMTWAVSNGIITGVTATTLEPQGTATRAQAAAMLMRFVEM